MKRLAILLPFLLLGAVPVFGQETQTMDFQSSKIYGTGLEKSSLVIIKADNKRTQFYWNSQSPNDSAFSSIKPDWIDSIDVIKGQNAVDRFGEEGANGVIVLTLKEGTLQKLPGDVKDLFKEMNSQ